MRRMREFNIAMLGMWCWRLLVDNGSMCYRVLVARYGEEDVRLEVGGGGFLRAGGRWRVFEMG